MAAVRVLSTRTVRPPTETPCSPRVSSVPLASWDVAMLSCNYIQKGLLFPPPAMSTAAVVDHLAAALSETLADYYPVAGRFVTDKHRDDGGDIVGCSVSIDCGGQGVELLHAVADGVAMADVVPPDADVPVVVEAFFPLNGAVCHDGHDVPLFAAQVTELADGVFLGFACNHALADGAAFWDFLNAWAQISRSCSPPSSRRRPSLERWSPSASPIVLPCGDVAELIDRSPPPGPPLRSRMLHFSADTLAALKERARVELLAAGDTAGAAALTRFQALSSLMWRCITRARNRSLPPEQQQSATTTCRAAINNRGRLSPPLPPEYFGNSIDAVSTDSVSSSDLLLRPGRHGWAAAAVGRAVAAHTDEEIRSRVAAWIASPVVYTARWYDPRGTFMGSSPRFDMYGCDFGWGRPAAVRSGKANKVGGRASLYPGREGGMDAEVSLAPEHMAALEQDAEFWAAVSPDAPAPEGKA